MDPSRFDVQLVSSELVDGSGLDLIASSSCAFGNTGTHDYNGALTTGSTAALQALLPGYSSSQASGVITALMSASDHLPVVAYYQIPATLSARADTLSYSVSRSGDHSASGTTGAAGEIASRSLSGDAGCR